MFQRVLSFFIDGFNAFGTVFINLFKTVISIFWNGQDFTFWGVIFLITFIVSLILLVLSFMFGYLGLGGGLANDEED